MEVTELLTSYIGADSKYQFALGTSGAIWVITTDLIPVPVLSVGVRSNTVVEIKINSEVEDLKILSLRFILLTRYSSNSTFEETEMSFNRATSEILTGADALRYKGRTSISNNNKELN